MILGFRCEETKKVFEGQMSRVFPPDIQRTARRKLRQIDAATTLQDLRSPPGNRLEALRGNRAGQHSIRVNDQWRVCFIWHSSGAYDVEMCDYQG